MQTNMVFSWSFHLWKNLFSAW